MADTEPPLRIILYFGLVGTAVFFPFLFQSGYWPGLREWLLMAAVGVTATVGQLFLTTGITKAPVSRASLGASFIIVLNIAGGWLWWGEIPDALTWVGCVLIVGGIFGLTAAVRRRLLVTVAE
jgi:drug/metabolite transporter (DMT)-like permease